MEKSLQAELKALNDSHKEKVEQLQEQKKEQDKYYDSIINKIQKQRDEDKSAHDAKVKQLKEQQDLVSKQYDEQITSLRSQLESINSLYDSRIKALQTQISLLDKQASEEEKLLNIEKKRQELEKLKGQKTVQVYTHENGWVWDIDTEAVNKAQEELDSLVKQYEQDKIKEQLQAQVDALQAAKEQSAAILQQQIAQLEEAKTKALEKIAEWIEAQEEAADKRAEIADKETEIWQNAKEHNQKALDDSIAQLEEMKDKSAQNIEEQIENLKVLKEQWSKSLDLSEQCKNYNSFLNRILDDEVTSNSQRLDELKSFVTKWNQEISKMMQLALDNKSSKIPLSAHVVNTASSIKSSLKSAVGGSFAKGGEVDYTGLAEVHGTESEPELMLNQTGIKNVGAAVGITGSTKDVAEELNKANSGELDTIKLLSDFVNSNNSISALSLDFSPNARTANINSISSQLGMRSMPNLSSYERVSSNNSGSGDVNLDIGDIKVYGVQDSDSLSKAVVDKFPALLIQEINRRR